MHAHLKKGLLATSLALAFGSFTPAYAADAIDFDPDGTGGANSALTIGSIDWAVAAALADNVFPITSIPSSPFNLYFHTALATVNLASGNPSPAITGLNGTFEITVIGGFSEVVTSANLGPQILLDDGGDGAGGGNDIYTRVGSIDLSLGGGSTNFITVFYDDFSSGQQSDVLAGTGYDDGTVILQAEISSATGVFTSRESFIDVDNDGIYTAGIDTVIHVDIDDNGNITGIDNPGLLDSFNDDDWNGQLSVQGDGSTSIVADILSYDPTFFITAITQFLLTLDHTGETNLPFAQTNPSKSFDADNTNNGGSQVCLAGEVDCIDEGLDLGTVNGGLFGDAGQDLLLQSDSSTSFTLANRTVPEPSILGLLGIGLIGLALSRGRRAC